MKEVKKKQGTKTREKAERKRADPKIKEVCAGKNSKKKKQQQKK